MHGRAVADLNRGPLTISPRQQVRRPKKTEKRAVSQPPSGGLPPRVWMLAVGGGAVLIGATLAAIFAAVVLS